VQFDETRYAAMKELEAKANAALTMEELKTIIEEFTPMTVENYKDLVEHAKGGKYLWVNPATGKIFLSINDRISSKPLPQAFVDRIIISVEKKIDVKPLVLCWARFMRNPNYTDAKARLFANYISTTFLNGELKEKLLEDGINEDIAKERATTPDVSITQEGLLLTYKVSNEIDWRFVEGEDESVKKVSRYGFEIDDITGLKTYKEPEFVEDRVFQPAVMNDRGDAFFCGDKEGHIIKVGQVHYLAGWDKVNCNDNSSCVKGLHCGGLSYIRSYQGEGTVTHNIFVDPMDIGAFDNSGNGAIRVLRYFVHSSFAGVNRAIYHSSQYAKQTDAAYEKMIEEAVAVHQQKTVAITVELGEAQILKTLS
jgi:hypothetical protein